MQRPESGETFGVAVRVVEDNKGGLVTSLLMPGDWSEELDAWLSENFSAVKQAGHVTPDQRAPACRQRRTEC